MFEKIPFLKVLLADKLLKNLCTFCLVSVKQDTKIFKITLTIL